MNKEKFRKQHLIIYGIGILISLFALYKFAFVKDTAKKIILIVIALGWLVSAVFGFIRNLKK